MLEESYDSEDAIPAAYRHLYKEADGKFSLRTGSEIKTIDDVNAVKKATAKEREKSAGLETELRDYKALGEITEVQEALDKIPALEAAADGNFDQAKVDELAEKKAKTLLLPVQRENDRLKTELEDSNGKVTKFQADEGVRTVSDAIREEALKQKVIPETLDDIILRGNSELEISDGVVVEKETGLPVEAWLTGKQASKPYWWPQSQSAGATGSSGGGAVTKNPWSREHWNLTDQGKVMAADPIKADRLAEAAGTTANGDMPAAKA